MAADIVRPGPPAANNLERLSPSEVGNHAGGFAGVPNRRDVMNMMTAITACTALSSPAQAFVGTIEPQPLSRAHWDNLERRWRRAKAACEAAEQAINQALVACAAESPLSDMIDYRRFPHEDRRWVAERMDLDATWRAYQDGEGKWWWSRDPEQNKREYRAALDSIAAYRKGVREAEEKYGVARLDNELDKSIKALGRARAELIATPAPHGEALLLKAEILFGADECEDGCLLQWSTGQVEPFLADVRRLAIALDRI